MIVLTDDVSMLGVLFQDSIENGELFNYNSLMQLLFLGVTKPDNWFSNLV